MLVYHFNNFPKRNYCTKSLYTGKYKVLGAIVKGDRPSVKSGVIIPHLSHWIGDKENEVYNRN